MRIDQETGYGMGLRRARMEPSDKRPVTDDELIARIASGDEAACRVLIERHLGAVIGFAQRMIGNRAEAEEIAQDAFLKLWMNAEKWEPGRAQAKTWLMRVASNQAIDRLRRRRGVTLDDVPEPASEAPSADNAMIEDERQAALVAAIEALPDRQRMAICLVHYDGMSNIETACAMDLSVEAVESLLARARRQLKAALSAAGWETAASTKRARAGGETT